MSHTALTVRMAFYGSVFRSTDQQGLRPAALTEEQQELADELALQWLSPDPPLNVG